MGKLGLTIVRPNFLSVPGTLGYWTSSQILYHLGRNTFSCYIGASYDMIEFVNVSWLLVKLLA